MGLRDCAVIYVIRPIWRPVGELREEYGVGTRRVGVAREHSKRQLTGLRQKGTAME